MKNLFLLFTFFLLISCSEDNLEFDFDQKSQNDNKTIPIPNSPNSNCTEFAALVEGTQCFNNSVSNPSGYNYSIYAGSGNIVNFDRKVYIAIYQELKIKLGPDCDEFTSGGYQEIGGGTVIIPAGENTSNNLSVFRNIMISSKSYCDDKPIGEVKIKISGMTNMNSNQPIYESEVCPWAELTFFVDNCYQFTFIEDNGNDEDPNNPGEDPNNP